VKGLTYDVAIENRQPFDGKDTENNRRVSFMDNNKAIDKSTWLFSQDEVECLAIKYGPELKNRIKILSDLDAVEGALSFKSNIEKNGGTIIAMRYNDDLAVAFWHTLESAF
jgi:hypothetical protein